MDGAARRALKRRSVAADWYPGHRQEHHDLIGLFDQLLSNPDAYTGTERFSEVLHQLGVQFKKHFINVLCAAVSLW